MPGGGLMTSGDLARIRTINGGDQTWDPPGGPPFTSADFKLTLDESIALAVSLGRHLGSRVSLRLDFSAAQLPVSALARVGETAEVFRWDELSVLLLGLVAEYRLVRQPTYLYLLGGATLSSISGGRSDAYDQSRAAVRFGGGYHHRLGGAWGLRLEIRDTVQTFDFQDYRPPVPEGAPYPGISVENLGPQHLVEILLALNGRF
jgi:hypothetical protein